MFNEAKDHDLIHNLSYKITLIEKITIYYEKRIETFVYRILWQIEFFGPIILEMDFERIFEATFLSNFYHAISFRFGNI